MRTAKRFLLSGTAWTVATWLVFTNGGASATPALTRSLYLPIAFTACPHVTHATLYENEQLVAVLPASRVFQFTYYPDLGRVEPAAIQLRVEGEDVENGEPFHGRLAVTPEGVYTAKGRVDYDLSKELQKLRYKIDTHPPKVYLRIQCEKDSASISSEANIDPLGPNP